MSGRGQDGLMEDHDEKKGWMRPGGEGSGWLIDWNNERVTISYP